MLDAWREELKRAKRNEIGGVLFGEHVGTDEFTLLEFTIQRKRGGKTSFKRRWQEATRNLERFSKEYGNDHRRFNYLGEWHSHPNAPVSPSTMDIHTMRDLLKDESTDANFLVLIVLRVNGEKELEISANTFLASGHVLGCEIELTD